MVKKTACLSQIVLVFTLDAVIEKEFIEHIGDFYPRGGFL